MTIRINVLMTDDVLKMLDQQRGEADWLRDFQSRFSQKDFAGTLHHSDTDVLVTVQTVKALQPIVIIDLTSYNLSFYVLGVLEMALLKWTKDTLPGVVWYLQTADQMWEIKKRDEWLR